MNNTKMVILAILLFMMSSIFALEENVFTTIYSIGYVLGFTDDYSTLYGSSATYVGIAKWSESEGFELIDANFLPQSYSNNGYIAGEMNAVAGYINPEGQFVEIGNFSDGVQTGEYVSTAYAVNADGTVFAGMGWYPDFYVNPFYWTADEGIVNLDPGTVSGRVNVCNAEGNIFYGWKENQWGARQPVKWENGEMELLPTNMDSGDGEVMGVSENGEYLVGLSNGQGAVWHDGEILCSGETEGFWSTVYSKVSNNGIAVGVERNFIMQEQNGVIWSESTGKLTVNEYLELFGITVPEGYSIDYCSYVSADGTVFAGSAFTPDYNKVAWYVQIGSVSQIQGTITLNGSIGNIEDVNVSNGSVTVHPDANGNYTITTIAGTYTITASLPGYFSANYENVVVGENETVTGIDLTLNQFENPAVIQGVVSLYSWGEDITTAEISAGEYITHPNSNGEYSLIIPEGTYTLSAYLGLLVGMTIDEQFYQGGETYSQDFVIYHPDMQATITGNVTADGTNNLTRGKVRIENQSYNIDQNGGYYQTATYGQHDMICYVPGFKLQTQLINVDFEHFDNGLTQDFVLERDYYTANNINFDGTLNWNHPYPIDAIYDDFEDYSLGQTIVTAHPYWYGVYDDTASFPIISEHPQNVFAKALKFDGTDGIIDDVVMDLGQYLDGQYIVEFDIYIPEDYSAHFDLLHSLYSVTMGIEVFFREDGTLEILYEGNELDLTFEHNRWIHISNEINLDNDEGILRIDGEPIVTYNYSHDSTTNQVNEWAYLGYLNLSTDPRPESGETGLFYIDNIAEKSMDLENETVTYNIYLDDLETPIATGIDDVSFTFDNISEGQHIAGIEAIYSNGMTSDIAQFAFEYINDEQLLPPENVTVSENGLVSWDAPNRNLTGYNVYVDNELVAENISDTEYQLENLIDGTTYVAGVAAVYNDVDLSEIIEVEFIYHEVSNNDLVKKVTQLNSNYPNPFNPKTHISFSLETEAFVKVQIFNIKGQIVKTLIANTLPSGNHIVTWHGKDDNNQTVSSGVYYYRMTSGKYSSIQKMVLLK